MNTLLARVRKQPWLLAAPLVLVLSGSWVAARGSATAGSAVVTAVERGPFTVTVTTAGELRAREFVEIRAPHNAQQVGAYQMRIASLVPEGTVVEAGEVVARIDPSQLATRLSDVQLALQKAEAQWEQAMLDSALTLSAAREQIRNAELALEERRLAKEQAVYEPPTVQRQAEIDLERALRAVEQGKQDYQTRTEQAQAKMREVSADVERQRNLQARINEVMAGFTIRAPAPGMVIYVREWNGRKRTSGSQVNSFDPGVATLPDLSKMESLTYVNEIDVRRVAVGQPAVITLDADPTRRLAGTVASVANVGEQRPNTDAKVFEVRVTLTDPDTTLRPGMTTGNAIETLSLPDALSVPLEAVHADADVTFVYLQSGGTVVRQEIATGAMNEDAVVVTAGVEEGDLVLLSLPAEPGQLPLARLPALPGLGPAEDGAPEPPPVAGGDTPLAAPAAPADPNPRER